MNNFYAFPCLKWIGTRQQALLVTVAMLLFSMSMAHAQKAVQLIDQSDTGSFVTPSSPTYNTPNQGGMEWTTFSEGCDQETPSNNFENGLGNLHLLIFANDYTVNAGETFTLESLDFNVYVEPGMAVNNADIYFYEDSGNGPGEEISSVTAVTPTSSEDLGEAFDMDVVNVVFDLDDSVEFTGSGAETTYYVGVQIDYDGESSYMEVTTILNTLNVIYYYEPDEETWIPSTASESDNGFDDAYNGVISFYGECSDLAVCSGQPDAGEINGDATFDLCPNIGFNLAVTGADIDGSGFTVKWQEHDPENTDDTWTDIEGANGLTLNVPEGITQDTDYRFYVECDESGLADTTEPVSVTVNPLSECYCTPTYSIFGCLTSKITNVSLSGEFEVIDNDSECSNNAYGDYTDLTAPDLAPGETYTLSVSTDHISPISQQVRAWIDYNQDGQFSDGEKIADTEGAGLGGGTGTFAFTVYEDSEPGYYKMRVRLVQNSPSSPTFNACSVEGRGEAEDYTVEIIELDECAGTPTAGTVDEDFSVCVGNAFSISVSGASDPANGLERIWQSAPEGEGNWTDIEGATSNTYSSTEGIEEATDFRYKVTCINSVETAISEIITVSLSPGSGCYCTPTYSTACSSGDRISNVNLTGEFESFDNDSECSDGNYGDYTDLTPPDLTPGETYTLGVSTDYSFPTSEQVRAWIDYNGDGQFSDEEEIANTNGNGLVDGSSSFDFTVAEDVASGEYRMRVRLVYGSTAPSFDDCSDESYGETEDYTVEIIQLDDCEGTPTAGTIGDDFSVCTGSPFSINVSGATDPANGLVRIWQSSPAGDDDWTDIDGAASYTYSAPNGIMEPTDFRYKLTCTNSDETVFSDVIALSLKAANECYCIPQGGADNGNDIVNFTLGDLDNDSESGSSTTAPGYSDYSASVDPIELIPGENYEASLTTGPGSGNHGAAIWIDYNGDGIFVSSEKVTTLGIIISGDDTVTFPEFTVANSPGLHRLRVQYTAGQHGGDLDPCSVTTPNSETEDYTVNITEPDCLAPSDVSVEIENTTVVVDWTENGSATEWELIYGEPGFDPETEGASITVQSKPATINDLDPETDYEIYVVAICSDEVSSDPLGPEAFTTGELSVDQQNFENFTFYPNPVKGQLTLKAGMQIENVKVYNLLGQKVLSSKPNTVEAQLDTERLQTGIYLMKVTLDGNTKIFRVIKE